jgi:hypothetical protein
MNTKNKTIAILMALIIATMTIAPAIQAQTTVPTQVNVISGGSDSPPVIKAKWELPDDNPLMPGTQVDPPMAHDVVLQREYYAVVTDPQGIFDINRVYVDVYHPDGSFKYQAELFQVHDVPIATAMVLDADAAGVITYGPGFTLDDLIEEIEQFEAKLFKGIYELDYHQPCGLYKVEAYAYDQSNTRSEYLINYFDYLCGTGIECDFNAINFGDVEVSKNKWVSGDVEWDTPAPTIRNIGNTPAKICLFTDDMDFGMTSGEYNVEFDGRLDLEDPVVFDPYMWAELPGTLDLCRTDKISFSIHVKKGEGVHSGEMTISAIPA